MLVLTRRINQTIRVGASVQVIVLAIRGNHVRLGITAPAEVSVDREEVFLAKKADSALLVKQP